METNRRCSVYGGDQFVAENVLCEVKVPTVEGKRYRYHVHVARDVSQRLAKGHRYRLRMDDGSEEEIAFISVTSKPTGDVVVFERYREGPKMSKG